MKLLTRIFALSLAVICMMGITISASAAKSTLLSKLSSKSVTNITSARTIKQDLVVDEGKTLYVRNGGVLYVNTGATLTLKGDMKIANGGAVYVRGNIIVNDSSLLSCSGKIKILSSGSVKLDGRLWVNATGNINGKGKIYVNDSFSDIRYRGRITAKLVAPKPVRMNGATYVGGILIVNKQYSLPENYGSGLTDEAYNAYTKMKKASGHNMSIVSGFRSYQKQQNTFNYWCNKDGYDKAVTYSALPGHSEHQTGLAMDITSLSQTYANTAEGKWLAANCHKYGFIIRYPKGKTEITGYIYEPWHIRYLGTDIAKMVYDSGLTLEEFLGVA